MNNFKFFDGEGMPIIGFYGPHACDFVSKKGWGLPDYLTDECYQMIKDSGITLISYCENDYKENPGAVIRSLELAEKYGLGMYVTDSGLTGDMSKEDIEERIHAYGHYRSFKGIKVCDEPGSPFYGPVNRKLSDYYEVMAKLNRMPDVHGYINLFAFHPSWIGVDDNTIWLDREHYEAYVNEYCSKCTPRILSQDYYIFDAHSVEEAEEYFQNLEIMSTYSKKYEIPYWIHVQVGGQWNDEQKEKESLAYYPKDSEMMWNVNTALAYGAKGIQYFPLIQPYFFAFAKDGEMDFNRNGIIRADMQKGRWFSCVQKINKQIAVVGDYLMNMVFKEVVAKGYYAEKNLPHAKHASGSLRAVQMEDVENQYGMIAGCFLYDSREAFYVVNNDTQHSQKMMLLFDSVCDIEMIDGDGVKTRRGQEVRMELEPSGAKLVILSRETF